VEINNPETATEIGTGGCALYQVAYQCTYCGILIGANHAMKDAHPIHGKYACGLCYEDYQRDPVAFIQRASKTDHYGDTHRTAGQAASNDILIRQQQPLAQINEKGVVDTSGNLSNTLNELKALWKLRGWSSRNQNTTAEADLGRESVSAEGKK